MFDWCCSDAMIENISYELLTKIILLVGIVGNKFFIFCRLSPTLHNVALNTPALWTNLSTTCYIQPSSPTQVQQRYIEYLTWWTKRVMVRNDFLLTFEVNVWKKKEEKQWIELEGNPQAVIFKLIFCAHYLKTYGTGLGFLTCLFHSEMPWSLESIVFSSYRSSLEYSCYHLECATGIKPLLWAFNLPTLQKYSIPPVPSVLE